MSQFCFVLFYGTNSPPFQAMINMSGGSEAEDCRAGLPPEDESNASRFCRDAESAAMAAPGAELGRGGVQLSSAAGGFAMTLSWTKFNGKIMIYIEFCIRKIILNFRGVSYSWGVAPKNPDF